MLVSGKVLVVGGANPSAVASSEIYDPESGTWSNTGSLNFARYNATATLLNSGKVLLAGGSGGADFRYVAELYDPSSGLWSTTGSLITGRNVHAAVILTNGKILIAGGIGDTTPISQIGVTLSSAELYDPFTGTWTTTGSLGSARSYIAATSLADGKILIAGGYLYKVSATSLATSELYW